MSPKARCQIGIDVLMTLGLLFLVGAAIAVSDAAAFWNRNLWTYMLVQTRFVFLDFVESKLGLYLDYLAMMGSCIFLSHYAGQPLKKL